MVQAEERVDRRVIFRTHLVLSPAHLLVGGLLLIPGFLLQQSLLLRYAEVAGYMLLAAACGRRVLILPNLVAVAGIVAANLASPFGRVLVSLGPLPITGGALEDGLYKASVLIGLIYLSRLAVRDDLVLPGRFGALIARSFFFFGLITEGRHLLTEGEGGESEGAPSKRALRHAGDRLLERVDLLLRKLESGGKGGTRPPSRVALRSSPIGILAMGALVLVNSAAAYAGRFIP